MNHIIGPGSERKKIKIYQSLQEYENSPEILEEEQRIKEFREQRKAILEEFKPNIKQELTLENITSRYEQLKNSPYYNEKNKRWNKFKTSANNPSEISEKVESITQLLDVAILGRIGRTDEAIKLFFELKKELFNKDRDCWYVDNSHSSEENTAVQLMHLMAINPWQNLWELDHHDTIVPTIGRIKRIFYDTKMDLWNETKNDHNKTLFTQLLGILSNEKSTLIRKTYYQLESTGFIDNNKQCFQLDLNQKEDEDLILSNVELANVAIQQLRIYRENGITLYNKLMQTALYDPKTKEWNSRYNFKREIVSEDRESFTQLMNLYTLLYLLPDHKLPHNS